MPWGWVPTVTVAVTVSVAVSIARHRPRVEVGHVCGRTVRSDGNLSRASPDGDGGNDGVRGGIDRAHRAGEIVGNEHGRCGAGHACWQRAPDDRHHQSDHDDTGRGEEHAARPFVWRPLDPHDSLLDRLRLRRHDRGDFVEATGAPRQGIGTISQRALSRTTGTACRTCPACCLCWIDLLERQTGWIGQLPVHVPFAGVDRAGVATSHGDDDVCLAYHGVAQLLRFSPPISMPISAIAATTA